jgi:hypothetical protein
MGADEVGTVKGLTERRAILDRLIGDRGGRIANTAGDSVLAEFGSAVDAVQCAVDAQRCKCLCYGIPIPRHEPADFPRVKVARPLRPLMPVFFALPRFCSPRSPRATRPPR